MVIILFYLGIKSLTKSLRLMAMAFFFSLLLQLDGTTYLRT